MDKAAVESDGLPGISLMQRAGERVWREISSRWPESTRITIFAGSGNNGGDAFVVAILAKQQGKQVQFILKGDLSRQSETSAHFSRIWQQGGGDIVEWNAQEISGEVIVDGLLGIGLMNRHPFGVECEYRHCAAVRGRGRPDSYFYWCQSRAISG